MFLSPILLFHTGFLSSVSSQHFHSFAKNETADFCDQFSNSTCNKCLHHSSCFWCSATRRCLPIKRESRDLFHGCSFVQSHLVFCWMNVLCLLIIFVLLFSAVIFALGIGMYYGFRKLLWNRDWNFSRKTGTPYRTRIHTDQLYKITPESAVIYGEVVREQIRQNRAEPPNPKKGHEER